MLKVCQFCRSSYAVVETACPVCGAPLPPEPGPRPPQLETTPRAPAPADARRGQAEPIGLVASVD